MSRTNVAVAGHGPVLTTAPGARAIHVDAEANLRRSVLACMLWEDTHYEDGQAIADRIAGLVPKVDPGTVSAIAIQARTEFKLRHVPLLLVCEMAKHASHRPLVQLTAASVIQRADELAEILAIYSKNRKGTKKLNRLSKQLKLGIAQAFRKFDEYSLAKYNQDNEIKLRDVLFLTHPKPKNLAQKRLWKRLVDGELKAPDTWEVAISTAKGNPVETKREWTRLLREDQLGALALIRNLRNMTQAGVDRKLIIDALHQADISRVLPFRFVAAAGATSDFIDELDELLLRSAREARKLRGHTVLVVDVSGSMYSAGNISKRSDISRVEAAGALAAIARERCESVSIYATAGNDGTEVHKTKKVPAFHGLALVEQFRNDSLLCRELGGGGIFLTQCLDYIKSQETQTCDNLIVFTDEQDCDHKLNPAKADAFGKRNYLINISNEKNGIAYKPRWTHIDGFSEAVLDFVEATNRN